jgi:hypothetical protein
METVSARGDPFKHLATGWASGKRAVTYDEIIAIYETRPLKESRIFTAGLQIILPKEGGKHIVGNIGFSQKEHKNKKENRKKKWLTSFL